MFKKFDLAYIHAYISKNISKIEKIFRDSAKKGMELIDFVFTMLNFIDHESHETLYLTVALIDFFQAVAENEKLSASIKF